MTTSLKDVSSAQMIHALAEMNCFEHECTIYGYAWKDTDGRIRLTTSDNERSIYSSYQNKTLKWYLLSPVHQWTTRVLLSEETKENILLGLKLHLCERLSQQFDEKYFEILKELAVLPADSRAMPILLEWLKEIDGYFDEDAVLLFEGAVNFAYLSKHLTLENFLSFTSWIQQYRKQISRKVQVKDTYERTFFGIAYEIKRGHYRYLCNANKKTILDRIIELDTKGVFHTPIYFKKYFYHMSSELKNVRNQFEQAIRLLMNDMYLGRMNEIRKLELKNGNKIFLKKLQLAEKYLSEEGVNGIKYWGNRWNLIN